MKDILVILAGNWEGTLLPYRMKIPCEGITKETVIKNVALIDEMNQMPIFRDEFKKITSCETGDGELIFEATDKVFPLLQIIVSVDDGKNHFLLS